MARKKSKHKTNFHSTGNVNKLLQGTLDITRSGIGYVVVASGQGDVLVRPGDFNTALNGDLVRVKVTKESPTSNRKEGKISDVLERKQTEFIGTLQLSTNYAFFIPDTDKPMPDLYIPLESINGAQHRDKVVARLVKWNKGDRKPMGEIVSILSAEDENDMAMKAIIAENGFPIGFDEIITQQAEALPVKIASKEIKKRKDMRKRLTFTIDPADAKDFDDALSIKKLKGDAYEIGVHIADVSHYVEAGTELDKEAYKRATSVYLPDRVNPMLPEKISNELCSLRPHEDKLTFSAVFEINAKAEIKKYWLGRTVIHSDHRFNYDEVQQIIETGEGLYNEEIKLLNELARTMRKQRFKNGAINFSSQEVRFKLDEKGKPVGIVVKESKEAHQLIEEFMLLANRYVATHVHEIKSGKKPLPFPYRVHDMPDEQKLLPFVEFSKKFGHKFNMSSPETIATSFNQLLRDAQGKPEQHVLEQLGIRTMAKAAYTTENIGHYGLGFEYYCHFTSPIRRYPDVLAHRVLQTVLDGKPEADKKMEEKCKHCSERERAAMEAERAANKYKQVEYMSDYLGDEFDAVISGVAGFGFWAETIEHKCEGLIPLSDLNEYDDFKLIESDYSLVGLHSGQRFRMGDKVKIRVIASNLTKRQLDYEWVTDKKKRGNKRKK